MQYAELFCQSNFSFLQGASHPQELVTRAHELGYRALAITDECSLSGVVRAYKQLGELKTEGCQLKLICGSYFRLSDIACEVVLLAPDRDAYSELCQLISASRLRAEKGSYRTTLDDLLHTCHKCIALWLPRQRPLEMPAALKAHFHERLYIAFSNHLLSRQNQHNEELLQLADCEQLPLVATGAVLMHCRSRKPLQDVLNACYHNCTLDELGYRLEQNAERYLRPLEEIERLQPPEAIANTTAIADRCHFSLDELRYQYPSEVLPAGREAGEYLRELVEAGVKARWPRGPEPRIAGQIEKELALIAELGYEHYFLTIHDIVQYARSRHILYQGRGSAANSVACYCLFITEIDPHKIGLLFERFISRERNEPPDIDVDFEHERREEIIQYIYEKYGRERAGLAATKISYRFKSALRDIGKALGLGSATIEQLLAERTWWDTMEDFPRQMQKVGIDPRSSAGRMLPRLMEQIHGFPRHLSQHVGGFVITEQPLHTLVPIENAAMEDRTIVQWDKEDIEDLKLMKVDILALGMLTALRKSLTYMRLYGPSLRLQDIPTEDPAVYEMMCRADTVGVFQVESRAQMSMLPRLQPRNFYELTIEIAIVRPGPIQGGMVHPYLKRKQGLEPVSYPHENLRPVLERTLGVPIFQEQVIQLSMVAAGFNGGEADQLRRAMASWGKNGNLYQFQDKLVAGMLKNGYRPDFAQQLFEQMKGFGSYGFPESHSASFALLAYFSAWIKCHHPAAFYCGLLNSQPMGFYAPAQLVYDAQRHNVKVLPIDVLYSHWDHQIEFADNTSPSLSSSRRMPGSSEPQGVKLAPDERQTTPMLRLGLRLVKGLEQQSADTICQLREEHEITSMARFRQLTNLHRDQLALLASANAFRSLAENRYLNTWESLDREDEAASGHSHIPSNTVEDNTYSDYASTGLTLREHPIALLRRREEFRHCLKARDLAHCRDGKQVNVIGLVTCRQRPGSAAGVMFMTLEDETGTVNLVLWEQVQQRYRSEIRRGNVLEVSGRVQVGVEGEGSDYSVIHLVGREIRCLAWQEVQAVRSFK
ncbi:error-prone DNA polymerase [Microbulbifer yueqingensis]|uniref:Error-prone DNA polymerase n=1 Tax=Microbulbifer yueqingensis TaxID=658219 RepID=A0A1G8VD15_9GAMM|nr:error-prone DNA polymerase [Microbulbifer yueqingensis]SDJ64002.1 error-prone DNA polymerase [Microbulbifer yueqingensis]